MSRKCSRWLLAGAQCRRGEYHPLFAEACGLDQGALQESTGYTMLAVLRRDRDCDFGGAARIAQLQHADQAGVAIEGTQDQGLAPVERAEVRADRLIGHRPAESAIAIVLGQREHESANSGLLEHAEGSDDHRVTSG